MELQEEILKAILNKKILPLNVKIPIFFMKEATHDRFILQKNIKFKSYRLRVWV